MTQAQILKEIGRLPLTERLAIIEDALRLIRQDLPHVETSQQQVRKKRQLSTAAKALLADYETNDELTIFTVLDGEDFHAKR